MTRAEFDAEFMRTLRFVIQKHDRVNEQERVIRKVGSRPTREAALAEAQNNLDAAITQLGDTIYDAFGQPQEQRDAAD